MASKPQRFKPPKAPEKPPSVEIVPETAPGPTDPLLLATTSALEALSEAGAAIGMPEDKLERLFQRLTPLMTIALDEYHKAAIMDEAVRQFRAKMSGVADDVVNAINILHENMGLLYRVHLAICAKLGITAEDIAAVRVE